jgi:outer membrane protein TolC
MPRQLSRPPPAVLAAILLLVVPTAPVRAEGTPPAAAAPGATLEEVLAIAKRLSPDLAARALDTEAAQARVAIAGSLSDPTIRITADEIDRTSGPRLGKTYYTVEQEFPLWGKRDLKRAQAGADVARTQADARITEAELIEKVKVAFAQYYQADQSLRTTEDLHHVVHDIARVARTATHRAAVRSRRSTRPKSKIPGLRPSWSALRRASEAAPHVLMPCFSGRSTHP